MTNNVKSKMVLSSLLLTGWINTVAANDQPLQQAELDRLADQLQVRYQLLDNRPGPHCPRDPQGAIKPCYRAQLELTLPQASVSRDWSLWFSHVSPIQSVEGKSFTIRHHNGDLHELAPTAKFSGFTAGVTQKVVFQSEFWLLSKAELMPNYYLTAPQLAPRVVRSTQAGRDPETGLAKLPFVGPMNDPHRHGKRTPDDRSALATASQLYQEYRQWGGAQLPQASDLLPTPRSVQTRAGSLSLAGGIHLLKSTDKSLQAALQPALDRLARYGVAVQDHGVPVEVIMVATSELPSESYQLDIAAERITIRAGSTSGAFYALQSLAALLPVGSQTVPQLRIEDGPRYPWRGVHIDIARNFHDLEWLKHLLDQMAVVKLNRLHLHLADDEGWRLEIPALPELTEVGSKRCHDLSETNCLLPQLGSGPDATSAHTGAPINGYLSSEQYIALLRYAGARHIEVVPSLDMPGHARAAVRSMRARQQRLLAAGEPEQASAFLLDETADPTVYLSVQYYHDNTINVCLPSAYRFVETVLAEVKSLHARAGQPLTLFHVGADETAGAWHDSPACKQLLADGTSGVSSSKELGHYFLRKVGAILQREGVQLAGWSDGLESLTPADLPGTVYANAWTPLAWNGHYPAHKLANQGWRVIVSSPDVTYFDFPYAADPEEGGYAWGTRSASEYKVFSFMPDNLPAHAEFWPDRIGQPYVADDRAHRQSNGHSHQPLKPGTKFYGLQAQLWSETLRENQQLDYALFPRLQALAERAWHLADWELPYDTAGVRYDQHSKRFDSERAQARQRDWQRFAGLLAARVLPRLDHDYVQYRLPPVGAQVHNGLLLATQPFALIGSGLGPSIEYRLDGGPWLRYTGPVAVAPAAQVDVRSRSADGKRAGRTLTVDRPRPKAEARP